MSVGYGMIPEWRSAKSIARENGWTEAKTVYVFDGLVERGVAEKNANDEYRITGLGLAVGERMGVVKPVDQWGKS